MPHIILSEEQLQAIGEGGGSVEVIGPDNEPMGSLTLFTPEEREALARHRRNGGQPQPGIPGQRVQAFLQKLHEIDDQGGIDEATTKELLNRVQAGKPL